MEVVIRRISLLLLTNIILAQQIDYNKQIKNFPFILDANPIYAGNLGAACTAAVNANIKLELTLTWTSTTTCAANIYAEVGGILAPSTGQTITLTGSFEGTPTQHFSIASGGSFASTASFTMRNMLPQYWGIVGSGGNDTTVIQTALNNLAALNQTTLTFIPDTYIAGILTIPSNTTLSCISPTTFLQAANTATYQGTWVTLNSGDFVSSGCTFDGNNTNQSQPEWLVGAVDSSTSITFGATVQNGTAQGVHISNLGSHFTLSGKCSNMGALTLNYSECYGLQVNNGTTVHDINIGPLDIDGTSTGSYGISLTAVGTNSIIDGFSINNVFERTINNPNYTNVGIEMFSNSPSQNAAVKNGKVTGIAVLATGASSGSSGLDAVSIGGGTGNNNSIDISGCTVVGANQISVELIGYDLTAECNVTYSAGWQINGVQVPNMHNVQITGSCDACFGQGDVNIQVNSYNMTGISIKNFVSTGSLATEGVVFANTGGSFTGVLSNLNIDNPNFSGFTVSAVHINDYTSEMTITGGTIDGSAVTSTSGGLISINGAHGHDNKIIGTQIQNAPASMHCVFFQDTQTNAAVVGVTANNCNQYGIFMALGGASDYPANPIIAGNYISNSGGGIALTNSTNVTLGINYFYNNTSNINYGGATFSSVTTTDGYNGMVLIEPGNSGQNVALFSNLATTSAYIRKIGGTVASPQGFNDCFSRWGGGTFLRSYTDYFCAVLTGNNQYQLQYMPSGVSPIDIGPSTNPYANFNSLAGGGFSIGVFGLSPTNVIHWDSTNLLQLFHLGTSGSGGGVYLCIDSGNHVYQKSSCP